MKATLLRVLLLPVLFAGAPPLTAQAPEPVQQLPIVDRAIAYHGGELYRESDSELELCSLSGCYHLRVKLEGDLYDTTVSGKVRGTRRTVRSTNDTVEVWQDGEPVAVAPDQQQRYRDWAMARIYFCFLPYRLNDPGVYKQDLGIEDWNGRRLHKVEVSFAPGSSTDAGDRYLYWFDPETGRLEQFAYSYEGSPGGLRFRRAFNHRRVGGILFFDQENLGAEGDELTLLDLSREGFVAEEMRLVSTIKLSEIRVSRAGD